MTVATCSQLVSTSSWRSPEPKALSGPCCPADAAPYSSRNVSLLFALVQTPAGAPQHNCTPSEGHVEVRPTTQREHYYPECLHHRKTNLRQGTRLPRQEGLRGDTMPGPCRSCALPVPRHHLGSCSGQGKRSFCAVRSPFPPLYPPLSFFLIRSKGSSERSQAASTLLRALHVRSRPRRIPPGRISQISILSTSPSYSVSWAAC